MSRQRAFSRFSPALGQTPGLETIREKARSLPEGSPVGTQQAAGVGFIWAAAILGSYAIWKGFLAKPAEPITRHIQSDDATFIDVDPGMIIESRSV